MDRDRLAGADFLRALGCILILLHHYAETIDPTNLSSFPRFVVQQLVSSDPIGISIFFALSGFLLAWPFWKSLDDGRDFPSLRKFVYRRGARIIPGYLLALSVTFVLSVILFGRTLDMELFERFIAGLLLINGWNWISFFPVEINGPLWSLSFFVASYACLIIAFAALFAHRSSFRHAWQGRAAWFLVILTSLLLHAIFLKMLRPPATLNTWDDGFVGLARMLWPSYNPVGFFAMFAIGSLTAGLLAMKRGEHTRPDLAYRVGFLVMGTLAVVSFGGLITGEGLSFGLPSLFPFGPPVCRHGAADSTCFPEDFVTYRECFGPVHRQDFVWDLCVARAVHRTGKIYRSEIWLRGGRRTTQLAGGAGYAVRHDYSSVRSRLPELPLF